MPLYYAALLGFSTVARLLLDAGADVNAQGGHYGNALQAASAKGHEQVVKMLLRQDKSVYAKIRETKQRSRSASGEDKMLERKGVLERIVHLRKEEMVYRQTVEQALSHGYIRVVKLLLDKGVEAGEMSAWYTGLLKVVSNSGYEQIALLLVERGVDVNAQGGHYGNALQAASAGGHEQVVKTLLNKGAEVNVQGGRYGNALQAASAGGHEQVVKTLLNAGAEVST
jgi:ankyrin repeat protein